jgi:hypothetical protein
VRLFSTSYTPRPVLLTDQSSHSLTRDTCFLGGLRHAKIEGLCFLCVFRADRIRENTGMGLTGLEFRSSKGTAMWPEEELEDLVCDVTCAVIHRYWECVI